MEFLEIIDRETGNRLTLAQLDGGTTYLVAKSDEEPSFVSARSARKVLRTWMKQQTAIQSLDEIG